MKKTVDYYLNLPYTIEITPYKDGGFFARVKELEGCMTEADTIEEATKMLEDAKKCWLETAVEEGIDIPLPESLKEEKEYKGKVLLRLPRTLHKKIAENARKEGVSLNTYIVALLSERNKEKEILRESVKTGELIEEYLDDRYSIYGTFETRIKPIKAS